MSYLVNEPQLVVSELNYNPYEPTDAEVAAGFTNSDSFEFIEVLNAGTTAANLIGTEFTNGVEFEFPSMAIEPGERAVLVADMAAFQQRYGTDVTVIGEYAGNLNNNGEAVTLENSLGTVMADLWYGDSQLWPRSADGSGATLQLIDLENTPADQLGKHYKLAWQYRIWRLARHCRRFNAWRRRERGADEHGLDR